MLSEIVFPFSCTLNAVLLAKKYLFFIFFSTCGPNWTQVFSHKIGYIPVPIGLYLL